MSQISPEKNKTKKALRKSHNSADPFCIARLVCTEAVILVSGEIFSEQR